jgi:hypothetical protein
MPDPPISKIAMHLAHGERQIRLPVAGTVNA